LKNSNAHRFKTACALKWYEAHRLKKCRGANCVQNFFFLCKIVSKIVYKIAQKLCTKVMYKIVQIITQKFYKSLHKNCTNHYTKNVQKSVYKNCVQIFLCYKFPTLLKTASLQKFLAIKIIISWPNKKN